MPEISVIVPVYNVERYLCRCIDSITGQTFKDFELILVDDGSPDQCGEICEKYAGRDKRIHVIHQENGGLSAARNAGIDWVFANSGTQWLTFVDSDDWLHPRFLEVLLKAVKKQGTDISIGNALWTHGEALPESIDAEPVLWRMDAYYLKNTINATVAWGKIYRRSCFQHIRYPVGKIHEDEYVTYRILFKHTYVSVIDQPLYGYFQNDEGIIKRKWTPARLDAVEAQRRQVSFFLARGEQEIAKSRFSALVYTIIYNLDEVAKSKELSISERKYYTRMLRKLLRSLLLRCRKYHWVTLKDNRPLFANCFSSLSFLRRIWLDIIKPVYRNIRSQKKRTQKNIPVINILLRKVRHSQIKKEDRSMILKYIRTVAFRKAVLLQSPLHGNLGDQAIYKAEAEMLNRLKVSFCDFPWTCGIENECAAVTPSGKLVLLHGGGYLGQLWPGEESRFRETLKAFRRNRIIVFPQTIFFDMESEEGRECLEESKRIYEGHPDLTVFVRERFSFQFMRKYMPKVHVEMVPDMAMILSCSFDNKKRHGAMICLRKDREKTVSEEDREKLLSFVNAKYQRIFVTDTVLPDNFSIDQRESALTKKLAEFASVKLVVTDRLHGMIFAAITETPCIVVNSRSYKIRGSFEWLKDLGYIRFMEKPEEIPALMQELEKMKPQYPREKAECSMKPLYDLIKNSI